MGSLGVSLARCGPSSEVGRVVGRGWDVFRYHAIDRYLSDITIVFRANLFGQTA